MNPNTKELAREASRMARTTANETKNVRLRELAVAVFGLAMAVEEIADFLNKKLRKDGKAKVLRANRTRKRVKV
jgi:hypothetical protein